MAFVLDPIVSVNLVLCLVIVILGVICYRKNRESVLPLYIGAAFGLFGISHSATLAGLAASLTVPLIIIRTLAYLLVIFALWQHLQVGLIILEGRQAWVDHFKDEIRQPGKKD